MVGLLKSFLLMSVVSHTREPTTLHLMTTVANSISPSNGSHKNKTNS